MRPLLACFWVIVWSVKRYQQAFSEQQVARSPGAKQGARNSAADIISGEGAGDCGQENEDMVHV